MCAYVLNCVATNHSQIPYSGIIHMLVLWYKQCKNCRDETVPKTVATRRPCKVGANNLPQPSKKLMRIYPGGPGRSGDI